MKNTFDNFLGRGRSPSAPQNGRGRSPSAPQFHHAAERPEVAPHHAGFPRRRAGFTLLEMLVVIVVMAMLMGITFRMMKPSEHARTISATVKTLALANAAITEYQAEYGIYPPVRDKIPYGLHGGLAVEGDPDSSAKCGFAPGGAAGYLGPRVSTVRNWRSYFKRDPQDGYSEQHFCFGLASFLIDRRETDIISGGGDPFSALFGSMGSSDLKRFFGEESWWYDQGKGIRKWGGISSASKLYDALEPSAKDLAFYTRVRSLVKGILKSWGYSSGNKGSIGDCFYYTFRDSFTSTGRDLIYICPPPHTSYALFSAGPDGKVVTNDPLNPEAKCPTCGQYHNSDNVYSSANVK